MAIPFAGWKSLSSSAIETDHDEPLPMNRSFQLQGVDAFISFTLVSNRNYHLQRTDSLVAGPWTSVVESVASIGMVMTLPGGTLRRNRHGPNKSSRCSKKYR